MCGRFTQTTGELPGLTTVTAEEEDAPLRYNGAPGQDFWIIRQHPETGQYHRDLLTWGLIPHWSKDSSGGRKPINARGETVANLPSFRAAYAKRRCLLAIQNFFEWQKVKGAGLKQPYAIAMKDGLPFALAAVWESWRHPDTDEIVRTFCIITCPANALVATIHDRMPVIIPPEAYERWLSPLEPDPYDLLMPFPPELMTMWPISTRVNSPANDDPSILEPVQD
jgi:putative SOS response-associated peptidase YedK